MPHLAVPVDAEASAGPVLLILGIFCFEWRLAGLTARAVRKALTCLGKDHISNTHVHAPVNVITIRVYIYIYM